MTHATRSCALAAALAGCGEEVPETPTWAADVAPLLAANCVRCHADPAIEGAPDSFVLDRPDGYLTDDGRVVLGARNMAYYVRVRTTDGSMPPIGPLSDAQIETLERFADLPAADDEAGPLGYGPVLGDPRPGNRAPTMSLQLAEPDADGFVAATYEIRDLDDDLVTGRLEARAGDDARVVTTSLTSGRGGFRWDVAARPAGRTALVAVLDDGGGAVELAVGRFDVPAGPRAPTVAVFMEPEGLVTRADVDAAGVVELDAADGADLRLTVEAVRGDDAITLIDDAPAIRGEGLVPWPHDDVAAGDGWRLVATVSGGGFTRRARSQPFAVGAGSTDLRWADVEPAFNRSCGLCHRGNGSTLHLPWDFRVYPAAEQGVAAARGPVYRRVVQQANMPPKSAEIASGQDPMPAEDRARIAEWLLGGAPE